MKSSVYLTIGLWFCLSFSLLPHHPFAAQESTGEPLISLSAANQPLVEVLDQITAETGYQFNLSPKWGNHRVSATLNAIPLERGLKRLLRSLNHSIVWESDRIITIMVYGKVEPGSDGGAISFAPPPREIPRDPEPVADEENNPVESEETEDVAITASGEEAEAETEAGDADGRDDGPSIDREIPRE